MNPYATEEFNRLTVKKQASQKTQEEDGKTDHPLFEGKKIDMSKQELRNFTMAMEQPEFRSILNDYVKEISDPNNQKEYETYLRQLEEQGDLPVGTKLIKPIGLFCIKTMSKKLISDINKQYFDQKTFINICMHELVEKPQREYVNNPNGKSGYSWSLPYRVSKGRHDQDKNGVLCSTYDIVFHIDVGNFLIHSDFKKFVCDTAIDGVNRVLAEHKEKVSQDYKILKNLKCKGGEPGLLTVKVQTENKLLSNYDISQHETSLQKEITHSAEQHKQQQQEDSKQTNQKQSLEEVNEEDENQEQDEPRPKGIVQPKYKIVYSYPVELADCWEGPDGIKQNHKIPNYLTVTLNVQDIESIKQAKLDINETTLIFSYPDLYYLDLNLKYKCDANNGNAKFDKTKKTLTIKLPIIGLTEDSQKFQEENYQKYQDSQQKRLESLKSNEEDEKEEQSTNIQHQETIEGEGRKILPAIDMSGADTNIQDEYNMDDQVNLEQLKQEALKEEPNEDDRTKFLKIFKENNNGKDQGEENTLSKEIKFKREEEDEIDEKIRITALINSQSAKPLIQEIKSQNSIPEQKSELKNNSQQQIQEVKPFDWDLAEKIDAKFQFLHQKEYVFVNLQFKGYQKDQDVRYALSQNELLIEVRDKQNKVNKLCKTLNKEIIIDQSSVELFVDFISIKLKKLEANQVWDSLGYDISNFTIPMKSQMKSNFLKIQEIKQEQKQQNFDEKKNEDIWEKEEEKEEGLVKEEEIQQKLEKQSGKQISFMNLESSIIYKIF